MKSISGLFDILFSLLFVFFFIYPVKAFCQTEASMPSKTNISEICQTEEQHSEVHKCTDENCKENHKHEDKQSSDSLPDVNPDSHNKKECLICTEYFAQPWVISNKVIPWMQAKSLKIFIFIVVFYIYLKRERVLNLLRRFIQDNKS